MWDCQQYDWGQQQTGKDKALISIVHAIPKHRWLHLYIIQRHLFSCTKCLVWRRTNGQRVAQVALHCLSWTSVYRKHLLRRHAYARWNVAVYSLLIFRDESRFLIVLDVAAFVGWGSQADVLFPCLFGVPYSHYDWRYLVIYVLWYLVTFRHNSHLYKIRILHKRYPVTYWTGFTFRLAGINFHHGKKKYARNMCHYSLRFQPPQNLPDMAAQVHEIWWDIIHNNIEYRNISIRFHNFIYIYGCSTLF